MNAFSLLIDLGGTDIKFSLAQGSRLISESIQRFNMPPILDKKKGTISSKKFIRLIEENIDMYLLAEKRVERILFSGQMGSWILTDSKGDPLTEIVSWQSTYSTSGEILESIYLDDYISVTEPLTGTGKEDWIGAPWRIVPSFMASITELPREIFFHTLISWTIWELTNRNNHQIHLTDAAATGMFSHTKNAWMGKFDILNTKITFPEVLNSLQSVGFLKGTCIPIFVGVADQQASLYGVGVTLQSFVINAGTGGQVGQVVTDFGNHLGKVRPYFDGKSLRTITHIPSGRYLNRFREFIESERGEILEWEWIWQRSGVDPKESLQMKIEDWDIDEFLKFLNLDAPTEKIADELIEQLSQNFISHLESLGCKSGDNVFLAGGVATKMKRLTEHLESMKVNILVTPSRETTLAGLAKLTNYLANERH